MGPQVRLVRPGRDQQNLPSWARSRLLAFRILPAATHYKSQKLLLILAGCARKKHADHLPCETLLTVVFAVRRLARQSNVSLWDKKPVLPDMCPHTDWDHLRSNFFFFFLLVFFFFFDSFILLFDVNFSLTYIIVFYLLLCIFEILYNKVVKQLKK